MQDKNLKLLHFVCVCVCVCIKNANDYILTNCPFILAICASRSAHAASLLPLPAAGALRFTERRKLRDDLGLDNRCFMSS